jgi:hypothetical protein
MQIPVRQTRIAFQTLLIVAIVVAIFTQTPLLFFTAVALGIIAFIFERMRWKAVVLLQSKSAAQPAHEESEAKAADIAEATEPVRLLHVPAAPMQALAPAPVRAPVQAPVQAPVRAPVQAPVQAPVRAPVQAPAPERNLEPAQPALAKKHALFPLSQSTLGHNGPEMYMSISERVGAVNAAKNCNLSAPTVEQQRRFKEKLACSYLRTMPGATPV